MFSRARRFSSLSTTYHGASEMSVCTIISSLAREYASQWVIDSRSIGESFQRRSGSSNRLRNRSCCSVSLTENQYLRSTIPASTSIRSNIGHCRRKSWYSSLVQKPITCSTPARLYQDRSNSTISPAAGRCSTYRWKYHWVRSRSVGLGSAAMRATRGLRCSATRLMVPPLPAASRPSKTTTSRTPSARTHSCSFTNSVCRHSSSFSYTLRGSVAAFLPVMPPPVSTTRGVGHPPSHVEPGGVSDREDCLPDPAPPPPPRR